jgi:hypothetical protein
MACPLLEAAFVSAIEQPGCHGENAGEVFEVGEIGVEIPWMPANSCGFFRTAGNFPGV